MTVKDLSKRLETLNQDEIICYAEIIPLGEGIGWDNIELIRGSDGGLYIMSSGDWIHKSAYYNIGTPILPCKKRKENKWTIS